MHLYERVLGESKVISHGSIGDGRREVRKTQIGIFSKENGESRIKCIVF